MTRPHDGRSSTPEYQTWRAMCARCKHNPTYRERGIRVVSEWKDPQTFIAYVLAHLGPHPGKGWSLDRTNNDRGYEPGNIRWATAKQQRANRRQIDMIAIAAKSAQTYRLRTTPEQRSMTSLASRDKARATLFAGSTAEERTARARAAGLRGGRPRKS